MHLSLRSISLPYVAGVAAGARARLRSERGTMMIEALVAISVFTLLGAAVLYSTGPDPDADEAS